MKPTELLSTFRAKLRTSGIVLNQAPPEDAFKALLEFYEHERAEGCDLESDGDMLLFQWGSNNWGAGPEVEIDLTRQVILPDKEDDQAIWQLHLTYRFLPTAELSKLGSGERWCSTPSELAELRAFMESTPAYQTLARLKPQGVTLDFECAG